MDNQNPFAALLQAAAPDKPEKSEEEPNALEEVFGFTLKERNAKERNLVFLSDLAATFPEHSLDVEVLEHALFERLLLEGEDKVKEVLMYLYDCYCKLGALEEEIRAAVKALIIRDVVTSLKQPDLYPEQNVNQQFYDLSKSDFGSKENFFEDLYEALENDEGMCFFVVQTSAE